MSDDKNSNDSYISLKNLLSESLFRDLILFCFLFFLVISQNWTDIILLVFPLITFGFSLFFRIINTNKWRTEFDNKFIIYNPFGIEKIQANRFFFSALFQLILIFWIGAESLYHPQLLSLYLPYFNLLLVFSYSFGFFWIFIDLWKYSKLEIIYNENDKEMAKNYETIVSFLSMKNFKLIILSNFLIFIGFNIFNTIFTFLFLQSPTLGIQLNLPGTGVLITSSIIFITLITSPAITIISLFLNYRELNTFSKEELEKVLKPLPKNAQFIIIENIKALNDKLKEKMNYE